MRTERLSGVHVASRPILGFATLLVLISTLYLMVGPRLIGLDSLLGLANGFDAGSFDHRVLQTIRMPRLVAALTTGACLGLSGLLLQGLLRNPLGEPHILGLNAGATLAVVVATAAPMGLATDGIARPLIAATGGGLLFLATIVFASAGKSGMTLLKVTFCGIAFSALASAVTSAILILDDDTLDQVRLWMVGDLAGARMDTLWASSWLLVPAVIAALYVSSCLNALALGDDVATGLGISVRRVRLIGIIAAALFCGIAVAIAGPIGFVGLIVPNLVRRFVSDYRLSVPLVALGGAGLLALADLAARLVMLPHEIPTGLATAFVGAPVFIILVARALR
ncbi:iron ABC transporter permease [Thalassospira sp. MCCC 1A02491]|uniref:FecCD family ABC transporter permease n=1 Tax=Thalassospira sp. MCCC 1A02491 TaxID=1769751 RepID=UPI000AA1E278|nr:iron ABC transporter permease [Thalassospira sp. MCCC 1A02491]